MIEKGVQRAADDTFAFGKRCISSDCANAVYDICASEGLLHEDSSLSLDATERTITSILNSNIPPPVKEEFEQNKADIVKIIMYSRYVNLFKLLGVSIIWEEMRFYLLH